MDSLSPVVTLTVWCEGDSLSARIGSEMTGGESPKISFRLARLHYERLREEALRAGRSVHTHARDRLIGALEHHDLLDVREAVDGVQLELENLRHDIAVSLQLVLLNLSGRKATREEVEEFVTSKLRGRGRRGL